MIIPKLVLNICLCTSVAFSLVLLHLGYLQVQDAIRLPVLAWAFLSGTDAVISTISLLVCRNFRDHPAMKYLGYSVVYGWFSFSHVMQFLTKFNGEEPQDESLEHGHSITEKVAFLRLFLVGEVLSFIFRLGLAFWGYEGMKQEQRVSRRR
jgi:hypothetical protein